MSRRRRIASGSAGTLAPAHQADLDRSGLTRETLARAQIRSADNGYAIPYFEPGGDEDTVFTNSKGDEVPFDRIRLVPPDGDRKYSQPAGTGSRLYFPRTVPAEVWQDPSVPLGMVEGEKKALKLIQEGFPALGLGGVRNWQSDGKPCPDLDKVVWAGRVCYILFDAPDILTKPGVWLAANELADELRRRGADVRIVILPVEGRDKVGADDYLVAHSAADLQALLDAAGVDFFQPFLDALETRQWKTDTVIDTAAYAAHHLASPSAKARALDALKKATELNLKDLERIAKEVGRPKAESADEPAEILWDAAPEPITRPLVLLTDGTVVAVVNLSVKVRDAKGSEGSDERPFLLVNRGGERTLIECAAAALAENGWVLRFDPSSVEPGRLRIERVRDLRDGCGPPDRIALHRRIAENYNHQTLFAAPDGCVTRDVCDVLALITLGTYFLPAFDTFAYTLHHGPKSSGKTDTLLLRQEIDYCAILTGNTTPSSLKRLAPLGLTLLIDEAEDLGNKDADLDKRSIILSGYKRGEKAILSEEVNGKWTVLRLETFAPRAFACIAGLDPVALSRCIRFSTLPQPKSPQASRSVSRHVLHDYAAIRDDAFTLALFGLPEVRRLYEQLDDDPDIKGRDFELCAPLLTLGRWIGGETMFERTRRTLIALLKDSADDQIDPLEEAILLALTNLLSMDPDVDQIDRTAEDILKHMKELDKDRFDEKTGEFGSLKSSTVGSALARLKFRPRRTSGRRGWEIGRSQVKERLESLRAGKVPSPPSQASQPSQPGSEAPQSASNAPTGQPSQPSPDNGPRDATAEADRTRSPAANDGYDGSDGSDGGKAGSAESTCESGHALRDLEEALSWE